jgi:hypothetical protein
VAAQPRSIPDRSRAPELSDAFQGPTKVPNARDTLLLVFGRVMYLSARKRENMGRKVLRGATVAAQPRSIRDRGRTAELSDAFQGPHERLSAAGTLQPAWRSMIPR